MCSKEIGRKKKNKEPDGDTETLPEDFSQKLDALTVEDLSVSWCIFLCLCLCVCVYYADSICN